MEATATHSVAALEEAQLTDKAHNNMVHLVETSRNKLIKTSMALEAPRKLEVTKGISSSNKVMQKEQGKQFTEIAGETITSSIAIQTNTKKRRGNTKM